MARISIPILGQASGKFADAEFLRLNGVNILRASKLKRYKPKNAINTYYQVLLKKIMQSFVPLSFLIRSMYLPNRSKLSFVNWWLKSNYHLFSLNINNYLIISSPEGFNFNNSNIPFFISCNIIDYSSGFIRFTCDSTFDLSNPDLEFFLICFTNNFGRSLFWNCSLISSNPYTFDFYFESPPFKSADFYAYLVVHDTISNTYSKASYAFLFQHG